MLVRKSWSGMSQVPLSGTTHTVDETVPTHIQPQHKIPFTKRDKLDKPLDELQKEGIYNRRSRSPTQ